MSICDFSSFDKAVASRFVVCPGVEIGISAKASFVSMPRVPLGKCVFRSGSRYFHIVACDYLTTIILAYDETVRLRLLTLSPLNVRLL